MPRITRNRTRKPHANKQKGGVVGDRIEIELHATDDEEHGHEEAESERLQLRLDELGLTFARPGREQAQHHARSERAEQDVETELGCDPHHEGEEQHDETHGQLPAGHQRRVDQPGEMAVEVASASIPAITTTMTKRASTMTVRAGRSLVRKRLVATIGPSSPIAAPAST